MKYPYIGKGTESGTIALIYGKDSAIVMDSKTWAAKNGDDKEVEERCFENITTEYLANTYGEVKSKEHADFIVKLAKSHDVEACVSWQKGKFFNFYTDSNGGLHLDFFDEKTAKDSGERLITIPLPLESNTNTPEEDFEIQQVAKNNGDNLIFGSADKCEEWPCVNDEVLLDGKKGVVKLPPSAQGYYVVAVDGIYTQCKFGELSKPKTPEGELRDEITKVIHDDVYKGMYDKESLSIFADALMSKFEITKKPQ